MDSQRGVFLLTVYCVFAMRVTCEAKETALLAGSQVLVECLLFIILAFLGSDC